MSCKIRNRNLATICKVHDLRITDLAFVLNCHRNSIRLYAGGLKPMPEVERRLASYLKTSIPKLHEFLFSKQRNNGSLPCGIELQARLLFWEFNSRSKKEKAFNSFERFASDYKTEMEMGRRLKKARICGRYLNSMKIKAKLYSVTDDGNEEEVFL